MCEEERWMEGTTPSTARLVNQSPWLRTPCWMEHWLLFIMLSLDWALLVIKDEKSHRVGSTWVFCGLRVGCYA